MNRGAWWATVHGVTKSWTQLGTDACLYTYKSVVLLTRAALALHLKC